jgi:alkylation response protein AidB-like acyl-CoA dehydrogenase
VGDELRINGRKTWTSDAMYCDYIFVLARTSQSPKKHEGISLILVNMHQPGVQVHPIRLLSGASPFNETVFEDALAPVNDVIGGIGNGWTVGKRLLQFERSTHAGINISGAQGGRTESSRMPERIRAATGESSGRIGNVNIRAGLIDWQLNSHAQRLTQARAIEELKARAPGFTSSAVKLTNALLTQRGDELLLEAMGTRGLSIESTTEDEDQVEQTKGWLYRKSLTIAGGTKEVQLNIIAKRVLGLPD